MVFESLVTDVLNNVLGDYVENLDSKQLKIGIWGGDVVLKNLVLKQSALNNLDLPVQAVYGRLSKLVLKIPWKNLYYSSVEASIEGLYLIVEPSQQIQYDAEKEEKRDFDAKQAMLAQVEEARKKKLEPKKQVDDSLVEKLTTQIIRNVQVSIKNIHVRYEDRITNPGHPFTMGVTLSKLIVQTTDSDWVPAVVYDDKAHVKIHKIIDLEGLAVYWNCNSLLYCTLPFDDIVDRLHSEIPTSTSVPEEYNYILGPISSSARVKINPKPEYDTPAFSIPKAIANLEIEKLSLGLTKLQYRDIIAFADSMDLMAKAVIYRKYRPNVPSYKGYYKEWWRFAYKCILEEEILRVRKNWSWSHMKKHRQLLRDYGQAYKMKLQDKKCPPEILSKLTEIEKELDVMNIVLVRQRIQLELERLGKAQEQQQQPSRGWFSSWWSKPEDVQKPTEQSSSLVSQFQAAMTPDEKQRLYNAIDYQENAAAVEFPPYFVENSCIFVLKSLEITLTDEDGEVLNANLEDVKLKVETRPVTSGLSVFVNIHKLMVLGIPQDDLIPELISSQTTEDNASLLDVTFETNPVDSIYGQRLYLVAKPLRVIYDAITINRALDVFKVPQSSALAQLSEATATTISDVKTRSTAGIQYLVDQHVLVDIKIDLYAPYLILPYGGVYRGAENIIVANLGYLKVTSTERLKSTIKEKHLKADADDVFKVLMEESYDKFIIELTQLQILLVPGGEEWMDVMKENKTSPLHLLKPISLFLTFHKCLIDNDPRLAQSKLSGILPSIKMVVSDHQIILLSALMNSIPFPKEEDSPGLKEMDAISVHSEATYTFMDKAASNIKMLELVTADRSSALREASKQKLDTVQFILMQINFIMEEFSVTVNHQEFTGSPFESVAEFSVSNLVLDVCTKTFVNSVTIKLGSLHLLKYHNNAEVEIIGTPICARPGTFLFKVDFVQVDKKCPDFKTTYNCCESMLSFEFALIKIVLHQEVLLELVKFTSDLQVQLEELQNTVDTFRASDFKRRLSSISDTLVVRSSMTTKPQTTKSTVSVSKSAVIETILFKLDAKLTELDLLFANDACDISQIFVKDLNLEVLMKKPYTQVKAVLREIEILDCTPHSIYPKILAIGDEEAINMQIVMYNREPEQVSFTGEDISIQATFGGLHFTFLNVYIATMSSFVDNFQAARAAIIEASQAAADKAKNNVTNIYENATRISLNVRMRAPKIVIPRNSKDYNALYIDLGNLHIANSFIILDIKNERDEPAVIDEIQLKLTDFKLSRIMTNIKRTITNDVTILLPLSFSLNVKRNLSSKWYKAIPEVHIVGQIESIEIHIGQPDYNMILATLNGNLAEGAKVEVQKPSSMVKVEVDQGVLTTASATTIKPCNDLILLDKTDGEIDIVDKNTYIFLKFNFMMNSFVVSLFTIDEKNEDKFSFTTKRHGLARLSLEGFSVKGRILSDNTMNTSVLLVDILLDDIRPGKEHRINRLFSRKVFGYTECLARTVTPFAFKTMVDVTYKKKNDDTYLDVRISSFDLILSMDFLSRVQKFFTAALEEAEGDVDVYAETKAKSTKGSSQSSRLSANVPAPPQSTGSFSFNIQIEQPDIVFVETMRSIDTNCLILNCEILIKLRIDGVRQSVSGTMKDIQMYTCYYNPEKRTNTKGNVLYPFTISIAGATPEGEGLHLEVCLTKMHLRVSPNIIELLNRVYVTMYRSSETAMVQDDTIQDHSQLWDFKPYKESDHWYLRTEVADEVDEDLGVVESKVKKLNEICFVRVPALIITVEAGIGNKTLPMLLMESHFDGKIKNWSSNMVMDATLTFQMGYYNSVLAVWEPLIEPVEDHKDGNDGYKPWELRMYVTINNIEEDTPVISPIAEGEFQEMITPQPRMVIEFTSSSNLEMTVTRTALEVLSALGNAFAEAVSTDTKYDVDIGAPYKVKNETGLNVKILLANSSFQVFNNPTPKEILLASGTEVPLELKPELERGELELNTDMKPIQKYLHLLFVQMNFEVVLNLIRADTRYFSLKYRGEFNNYWGIITQTVVEDGVIEATLSSIVKVYNDLDLPVDIYFMTPRGNELKSIGTIQPGSVFNVPMKAIYTPTNELFFSVPQYCVTNTPFIWKDLQSNVNQTQILLCHPKDEAEVGHSEPFVIKTVGKVEQVFNENTLRYTMASILCKVHLRPAVTFTNSLPVPISVSIQDINEETKLDPGSTIIMHHVNPGNSYIIVRLLTYFEREWSCIKDIPANLVEFSVWTFDSFQGSRKLSIDLGLHCLHENGTLVLALYCPFWMLNKSELNLSYRNSDENLNILLHPANRKDLILFSFNPKNFFGKKKASVRISNGGEWSDKFSIDVAGSSGVVTCKYEGKIYQLGVHIQLTYNNLTKQVTFTPYYVMINSAHFAIECQEFNRPADPWTPVQPNSCAALWPVGDHDDKLLKLRVVGTEEVSAPFFITESHTTLLKLKNKYGGVYVDIQITEGAVYINFFKYDDGLAPVLIINHTKDTLNIWEKETVQLRKLEAGYKFFYTWENPSGDRVLVWEAGYKKEIEDDLRKDGCGEYAVGDNNYVYWVSFLDGMQRVLLFTCDRTVAENAQQAKRFAIIDQEVTLSIHGIGLSLVNNLERREIMYLRIASSGIIWETCKNQGRRYKQLSQKDSNNIEEAYQLYQQRKFFSDEGIGRCVIDAKTEVDFDLNEMYKPHHRKIRRTFLTGLWMQMSTNATLMQLHAKINRLQIDNQIFDCLFPVVLAPVPLPKTVANTDVHRPFAELSIVQLLMKHSQIKQYKYFKVLIQEFHVKLDLAFVASVTNVFPQATQSDLEAEKQKFLLDVDLVNNPLYQHVSLQSQQEQKSFYDVLHFSPLKIHVSFSLASNDTSGQNVNTPNALNVLLQGLGVTLTDMQDVVFKLGFFEREYTFLTQKQLVNEASSHYIGQAIKQLYVLVLGLDVLGNPYGLVLGITKGVEDLFYEPFQGAIQGPGEFAEGLALGVRSLFGHTVGGAAGAVSRITGAMGKGLAALTFDKEYQRKRQNQLNKTPGSVQEGIARSGKGLVMGVYDGITGVVRKPISGAKEEGVGGFIKGLGKGAVGLVTRPTAGVIDFASSSLDTVKRVTELTGEEAQRVRFARYIPADGLITPYNCQNATGYKLLNEMDKGKYSNTDMYVYHYNVIFKKEVLLITDKRIAYIIHNDLFGGWQVNWTYTLQEIVMPPKVVPKGVAITLIDAKRRKLIYFRLRMSGKQS
ncbi:vacuolar protein sorting-associated protein vps13 [Holotrichia oblita]|uniref:Vacuolar protein sorting-associated protein vps13 n=1 Tax=Holotrichia oblita TaxID=644536 RepID=A0ACB9SZL6_HOLOL|nr:vacuolar protein sorting-associated protein vps13 [Holotrichia oblita]